MPGGVLSHADVVGGQAGDDRALEGREEEEGLLELAVLAEVEEGAIEADEDGELDEDGEAARERVDRLLLEEDAGAEVDEVGVVLELLLDTLDLGLNGLHLELSRIDLVIERVGNGLDAYHDANNG